MNKRPEISVIMLTYNREQYAARAIKSVLCQTFPDFEFIIVDNGSTDGSRAVAQAYERIDSRVRVVSIPKSTIGAGRNCGVRLSTGRFITFLDDDDWIEPDMLEYLLTLAAAYDAEISLCGSYKVVDGQTFPNCVFEEELVMDAAEAVVTLLKRKKYNSGMPSKLFSRRLLEKIPFLENSRYDDISVIYKHFANASRVAGKGDPKYYCYRHPGNNSAFTTNDALLTPEQLDEYFAVFRERTAYLSALLPEIGGYAQYSEWSYQISMCNKIISNHLENCRDQLAYVIAELTRHQEAFYHSPYIEEFERDYMRRYILTQKESAV
ncbi:MAG: glycosyltransferase [Oscillospiraceae bacterium]|nr:glycosyltransferase [Oscillospiraceae bacterium]